MEGEVIYGIIILMDGGRDELQYYCTAGGRDELRYYYTDRWRER
jgi:hypothetical protein